MYPGEKYDFISILSSLLISDSHYSNIHIRDVRQNSFYGKIIHSTIIKFHLKGLFTFKKSFHHWIHQ